MRPVTRGRTLAPILLAAGLLAACSSAGGTTNTSAASAAAPTTAASQDPTGTAGSSAAASPVGSAATGGLAPLQDNVTVRFGVFPNITHAPGLIALADDGPLHQLLPNAEIQVTQFNSGTPASEAMLSGALDITYIGPNPAINLFAKTNGEAVRVISGSTSGGAFLVVQPDIASAADLKGKTLATPGLGNTQDVALRSWLKENGLATDTAGGGDVSIVNQDNAQTLDTFKAGAIQGAWVPEPWATRLVQEAGAKVLVDERTLWPQGQYVTTHLLVTTKFLDQYPEVVKRILQANLEAVDEVNSDPTTAQAKVNAEIQKDTTKALGTDLLRAAWKNLTFTVDPIASSLQTSATDAEALGLLKDPGDLSKLYDLTLLNQLLQSEGKPPVKGL